MENGTQLTFEECMPETYQKQIVGVLDSRAKTSRSQESNSDFKEIVQACFSELCTLSDSSKKKINPLSFSLRTLKICLVLMEDGISPDCSLKWIGGVRCGMASAQLQRFRSAAEQRTVFHYRTS